MQELIAQKNKRIFWLGMHKVLVETELKRLRILGYEVFNPPYLSSIVDQSAVLDWKPPSNSTLPQEIIAVLAKTNFFYDAISPEIGEILNQYFGTVIVTINLNWLKNILRVYHGKLIYRVYGQPYALSRDFTKHYVLDLITEREDFWFCPHHEKTLLIEDEWIKRLNIRIIPYCVTDDVIALQDSWYRLENHNNIGFMCPRVLDNTYYRRHYDHLKCYFTDEKIKIFGAQVIPVNDLQIVGTLERKEFLTQLLELRGFIYHYSDRAVCYLPPIEFMMLGGPVLFLKDSLLSSYFEEIPAPGEARNMAVLSVLAEQLRRGDNKLTNEIIESQQKVRMLYHPSYVWPIFDKAITEIVKLNIPAPAANIICKTKKKYAHQVNLDTEKSILIPFHQLGANIERDKQLNYYSVEGILRVMNLMVNTLIKDSKTIVVTSHRQDLGKIYSFFAQHIEDHSKLKVLIIENNSIFFKKIKKSLSKVKAILLKEINRKIKLLLSIPKIKNFIDYLSKIKNFITYLCINFIKNFIAYLHTNPIKKFIDSPYIRAVNKDASISHVVIPHYSLFPEMQKIKKPIFMYLPDYMPHFYKGSVEMGDQWAWRRIGKKLTNKAKLIFTNSEFTRNYLPNSKLKVKKEKIVSFPLAYLNTVQEEDDNYNIQEFMKSMPPLFVFYPTRNRPSKRLGDFSEIIRIVNHRLQANGEKRRIYGVLTAPFRPSVLNKYLLILPTLSNQLLAAVYKQAAALLFTSENEGNFPTQINEAFCLGTPVIATNIPQITDELGEYSHALQLVPVGNCMKFAGSVLYTVDNRERVLRNQQKVREYALQHFSYERFSTEFLAIFSKELMELT
jgi:glycosyltransferase involved in cell wall biosynthesis